jgi:G protein-coupled receptor GPR1
MDEPTFDQERLQRILSITAASLSIVSGISVLFWWFVILPYRQRYLAKHAPHLVAARDRNEFRYHLTIALIIIDLLKAIILITYPIRYFNADTTNPQEQFPNIAVFCDVIGFLTVATIQSSDFAVLALAIHTALLIFGNSSNSAGSSSNNGNHNNVNHNSIGSGDDRDKGLYRYRYYIYSVFFVILPLAIASIGMVNNAGYTYFISWCYLVIEPMWYSLLLSWIPRLLIMVLISVIYVSIFIQMKMRMYHVSQAIQRASNYNDDNTSSSTELTLWQSVRIVFRSSQRSIQRRRRMRRRILTVLSYLPGLGSLNPVLRGPSDPEGSGINHASPIPPTIQELNQDYIQNYNYKRHKIERQVNSIFIYPLTYVLLYIFPLIQQCLYYTSGVPSTTEPVYWLALVAAWMKPFNCFVDTCVFVIREGAIPCLSPSRRELRKYNKFNRRQAKDFTNTHIVHSPPTNQGKRTDSSLTAKTGAVITTWVPAATTTRDRDSSSGGRSFSAGAATTTYVTGANNTIIEIAAPAAGTPPFDWEKFEIRPLAPPPPSPPLPMDLTAAGATTSKKRQQPRIIISRDPLDSGPVSPSTNPNNNAHHHHHIHRSGTLYYNTPGHYPTITNNDPQANRHPYDNPNNNNPNNDDNNNNNDDDDDDETMDLTQFLNSYR